MTRRICLALAIGLCLAARAPAARAQTTGWVLSLGVPLGLQYTHDPQLATPPGARFPTGLHVTLLSPLHVGVGLAAYRTRFADAAFPAAGRRVDYRLAEVFGALPFDDGWVALGYGMGRTTFSPVTATDSGLSQDYLASDVQEWFVLAAYHFSERLDGELGFHLLQVDARRTTNGAPASGALDGQLLSIGAGYRF
ncbi:MAG TPA: hypothetical protein VKB51_11425 [bacterium]|nr:hypothetical protein [bacterium]